MSSITCPAPDCATEWPSTTPPEVLLHLIDLHERTAHPSNHTSMLTPPPGAAKAEKVKQPMISAAGTCEEWAYFLQRWSDYKAVTHLAGSDVIYQLLECCEETLRKDLTRTFGALATSNEQTVLLNVQSFSARLRGQAGVSNFKVECSCSNQVDYSDIMIRDALIKGLADDEICLDILGESKQDMSL